MSDHESSPHGDQPAPGNPVNYGSYLALDHAHSLQNLAHRLSATLPEAVAGEVDARAE